MDRIELVDILKHNFYENYAFVVSELVLKNDCADLLFEIHFNYRKLNVAKVDKEKIAFRSSYVIERLYFMDKNILNPYLKSFYHNLPTIENGSMMRHYLKIAYDLLNRDYIPENSEDIGRFCVDVVVNPKVKVAVKVWAVDIIILLKRNYLWLDELFPSLLEILSKTPTPAIVCRIKKWKTYVK